MPDNFLTFQTFTDPETAAEMEAHLLENGIVVEVENNRTFFDVSYANNAFAADISLKLHPQDFDKARKVLEQYYAKEVDQVSSDYYLFSFSNAELTDILVRPDEWGYLDYQLARKILRQRGMTIDDSTIEELRAKRNNKLAQPEAANEFWIYVGYLLALVGPLGTLIACTLIFPKKTLPDGRSVYLYREQDRNHGTRILLISLISIVFWLIVRWWRTRQ